MSRDSQSKMSKKDIHKRSKKQEELNNKKKKVDNSDSDSDNGSDSENDEMDIHEYRKFISKMFPSKYLDKKVKSGEKLKKVLEEECEEDEEESYEKTKKNTKPSKSTKNKKPKKNNYEEDDEELWETASEEESIPKKNKKIVKNKKSKKIEVSDDEDEIIDDDISDEDKAGKGKVNIIFTIGGADEDEWEDDEYDSDYEGYEDSDDLTEDEDEEVSTDESDDDDEDYEEEDHEIPKKNYKNNKIVKDKQSLDKEKQVLDKEKQVLDKEKQVLDKEKQVLVREKQSLDKDKQASVREKQKQSSDKCLEQGTKYVEALEQLKLILELNPNDKSIQKCIDVYEQDIQAQKKKINKKEKKQKDKNLRIFRKILRDKNTMNDFSFYEKLDIEHQKKIIKELREINKITRIEKPYRMTLLESSIPVEFKSAAMKKINSLRYMEPGSGEFYKSKNWVDTFMRIPFNKYEGLPISIDDGVDKCHEFMETAQKTLDQAVYGLNDAKMQIMQMLGQLLTNPKAIGTAIAIHGPPGTGKTSLVKEGISKILNRPFAFIALGGATDSSFLEGHGYTYEGSTWGKIVQILIESKCMNPVIYFDELDKISDTPRGEEIAGILTHLTDTTQNSQFHDKYFSEINFDLSKCLFIFSYNDENKVNSILKDRMYRIKTKGYVSKEKTIIANNYLLPKIREQVKFTNDEIIIPNDVIGHIIDNHCNKEDGVRNLKRCLEIIYTKLNLYRLMKPGTNLFEGEMALKVDFPFNVTKDIVDKLIKRESDGLETWRTLYL